MYVEYNKKHEEAVTKLLISNNERIYWGDNASQTVLAFEQDVLIAIGSTWENELHPNRSYISAYVHPDMRNRGIGSTLIDYLMDSSDSNLFQSFVSSDNCSGIKFLNYEGFTLARKCYTPTILKEDMIHIDIEEKSQLTVFASLNYDQKKSLIKLQLQNYEMSHSKINSLNKQMSFDQWNEWILDDLDEEHSYVLIKNNEIEAYILCYKSANDNEIEVGYIGGKCTGQIEMYRYFYYDVFMCLFKSFKHVSIEADDVDFFAFTALSNCQYDKSQSLDTYIN